jgi:hypothetical protein
MRKYLKAVLITALVAVAVIIASWLLLYSIFGNTWLFGGLKGVLMTLRINARPNPEGPDIKNRRAKFVAQIESAFVRLMANSDFTFSETSSHDICYDGSYSWLNLGYSNTEYAHRCTLSLTRFYGFNGNFRDKMIEFEQRVIAEGWNSPANAAYNPDKPMESYMRSYYDSPNSLYRRLLREGSMRATVDSVAGPIGYHSAQFQMLIRWAERTSQYADSLNSWVRSHGGAGKRFFDKSDLHDGYEVLKKVTQDHQYVLAVTINGHYFED